MPEYNSPFGVGFNGTPEERAAFYVNNLNASNIAPRAYQLSAPVEPSLVTALTRRLLYKLWWAYYNNTVYESINQGGYRAVVNANLGDLKVSSLAGLFNPVERAVEAYQYVFDGAFGDTIQLDTFQPDGITPLTPGVQAAIDTVWRKSNMTQLMELATRYVAALGTVGLRVVMDNAKRVVYFSIEHPNVIRDVAVDMRGNITQLVLEYDVEEGEFDNPDNPRLVHSYTEYMTDEFIWFQRDGNWWNYDTKLNVQTREEAQVENLAGFVPYVLIKFKNVGLPFGVPCFYGQTVKVDHLNALATHIVTQIHRHVTATWVLEASGAKPESISLGDMNLIYIQRELGQNSAATMKALVAALPISEAGAEVARLQNELSNSMPELKATDGAFLSHQSGGTVAQLRTPAEQRIKKARTAMESGLITAQKMALSLGIIYGLWDLGTGQGSRAAADKAFSTGLLDHRFPQRPALPLSVTDQLILSKAVALAADPASGVSTNGGDNTAVPAASGAASQMEMIPAQTRTALEAAQNSGGSSTGA